MIFTALLVLVLLFNILLALFVFYKNPKNHINISFTVFVFSTVLWIVTNFLSNQFTDYNLAFLFNKLIFVVSPYIVFGLLYFSIVFPTTIWNFSVNKLIFFLLLPILLLNVLTGTNFVITGITFLEEGGTGVTFAPGIVYFAAQFLLYLIASIIILAKKFFKSRGYSRAQLEYLLLGIILFIVSATITNLIIPLVFNSFWVSNFGPFFSLAMFGFTAFAIVKHRLLDIRLIVARVVTYTFLIIILGAIYAIGILAVGAFVTGGVQPALELIASTVVLALIIAFTFQPIRHAAEKITDTIFYKHRYSTGKLLYELALIMASTLHLEHLTHKLLRELLSQIHISRGAFILIEGDKIYEVAHEGYTTTPEFDEKDIKELVDYHDMLILEELPEGNYKNILRKLDATVVVYLSTEGRYMGLLALGEKLSGDIYTSEDLRLLKIFAPEAAVAIQNAQSYEEIHRFSLTLQEEVNRATKELLIANKKLESLDKLKDEFLSLASHELRTPMTAIKSYLWMVLEGRVGKISEKQKDYLDIAYKSTDRLIALVNDMLNISRIESGKLTPDLKAVKLNQLVDDVVVEMTPRSTELGVEISVVSPTFPQVLADYNKIKEVLINLVGNSLKFTPRGGKITIKLQKKDNFVETSVSDTGAGIKTEDIPKLFQKFSMVGSSLHREKNTKGTGLGLYLSKLIVELHGGRIWAQSQGEGKGATLTFSLKVFEKQ